MNNKICAIFGESPNELEFGYDEEYFTCAEMKYRLVAAMESALSDGFSGFASTLEQGVPMWGAEACAAVKQLGGRVSLIASPISERQADRWHPERRDRYFSLLEAADLIVDANSSHNGEDYIFDISDRVIILGSLSHPRIKALARRAAELGKETVIL